jgi:hypothetical protein
VHTTCGSWLDESGWGIHADSVPLKDFYQEHHLKIAAAELHVEAYRAKRVAVLAQQLLNCIDILRNIPAAESTEPLLMRSSPWIAMIFRFYVDE